MTAVVYLECVEAGALKFWSGSVKGKVLTTRWGKIGTQGQSKEETFADAASAKASLDKQAAAKVKKGYKPATAGGRQQSAPIAATFTPKSKQRASPPAASSQSRAINPPKKNAAPAMSPMPTTKPELTAWLKDASRAGMELAAAVGKFRETDRLIAAHFATLPETLSKLSHSSDKATRAKVAANPNTPQADYVRLGQQFQAQFLSNPLFDALSLENPDFLKDWVASAGPISLLRAVMDPDCPKLLLEHAASLPAENFWDADEGPELWGLVKWSVALRSDLPTSVVHLLRRDPPPDVDKELPRSRQRTINAFKDWLGQLERFALSGLLVQLRETIELPKSSELQISDPFWDGNEDAEFIESVSDANRHIVLALLGVAEGVARNPNTPSAVLESLAKDKCIDVRCGVAQNPMSPVALLEMLARDKALCVRQAVSFNPNTPTSALELLRRDKSEEVRRMVAENLHAPNHVLEALSKDNAKNVRVAVGDNPHTPSSALTQLANDADPDVRNAVARNLMTLLPVLHALCLDKNRVVRIGAALNPQLPSELHHLLAGDEDEWVRLALAESRHEGGESVRVGKTITDKVKRDFGMWSFSFYEKRRPVGTGYSYYILHRWSLKPDLLTVLSCHRHSFVANAARKQLAQLGDHAFRKP